MPQLKPDATEIRVLMARQGINTLTDLADRAGISRPTMTRIMQEDPDFHSGTIDKLASVFSVDPGVLLKNGS